MAAIINSKATLTLTQDLVEKPSIKPCEPIKIDVACLPTENIEYIEPNASEAGRTVLHIYFEHGLPYKLITPTLSPSQERRWGPTSKQQKARCLAKKAAKKARLNPLAAQDVLNQDTLNQDVLNPQPQSDSQKRTLSDESVFFLHTPYLSFHLPPYVLYIGPSKYAPSYPVALIHTDCFWRTYKIQLGPSLSLPGVIDPRGVVSWRHNGGSKACLKHNEEKGNGKLLKGYKVRGWRLWGETGKQYVHGIREKRRKGMVFDDPDIDTPNENGVRTAKVAADEVVYLRWATPLSRHTRTYTFYFRGIEFQWKGTGTVSEGRKCGWLLRFCHLKLVAKVPLSDKRKMPLSGAEKAGEVGGRREVCLGKYTSSIAAEKSGTLEIFDGAVVRFVQDYVPTLLEEDSVDGEKADAGDEDEEDKIKKLKRGILYQLVVATVLCMANAEKEKRHTLIDLVIGIAENAGNGGG